MCWAHESNLARKDWFYENPARFAQRPPNSLAKRPIDPDMRGVFRGGIEFRCQSLSDNDRDVDLAQTKSRVAFKDIRFRRRSLERGGEVRVRPLVEHLTRRPVRTLIEVASVGINATVQDACSDQLAWRVLRRVCRRVVARHERRL